MTAYLALHELKPNQVVTAPAYRPSNPAEITLGLDAGERIRVRDLLYALLLPSASDAAETLAVAVSGSVPALRRRHESDRPEARPERHELRKSDRARRPRQLLERP